MQEHRIRLRGGWESIEIDNSQAVSTPVTLPFTSPRRGPRGVRLSRRFGAPPQCDPNREALYLAFEGVPGLRSARLNGRPLAFDGGADRFEIAVELAARNELILDAELPPADGPDPPWGQITLVIRPVPVANS